jgi:hypothetical protein
MPTIHQAKAYAFYTKEDLVYSDYQWPSTGQEEPSVSSPLGEDQFNRYAGREVLALINTIAQVHGLQYTISGKKIEKMIRKALPAQLSTRKEVKDWIVLNWNS